MRLSADVGGTFTDLVIEHEDGRFDLFKAPTTSDDPVRGVFDVLELAAGAAGVPLGELLGSCGLFMHATTRATNAVLTGGTCRVAFMTTKGHPDVLLLREGGRVDPFDNTVPFPEPLVPRRLTFEVPGRIRTSREPPFTPSTPVPRWRRWPARAALLSNGSTRSLKASRGIASMSETSDARRRPASRMAAP